MIRIHPIRTGSVQIKRAQRERKPGGLLRALMDDQWTEWLPIYAWAVEHPEGLIVVDTGETARTSEPGYFPRWHPYYRSSVRMQVAPEEEIGPQLEAAGLDRGEVWRVLLTHFHTDHAGGLHHFPNAEIMVDGAEYRSARGLFGRPQGYLPHRWPSWFAPTPIPFESSRLGPFERVFRVTTDGSVAVVPTPGHTPHHVSVIVRSEGVNYFLAGDTSYTEELLLARTPDGVSPRKSTTRRTMDAILAYAQSEPTVYLPSHDPRSEERLKTIQTLPVAGQSVAG